MSENYNMLSGGKNPMSLDSLSVDELREYRKTLEEEMKRVEAEIEKKEAYKQSLDSVFK